ncbi:MAG: hypothetical protein BWY97_00069 [Tenericutes bacterium ADurb.BinA124]|nr:MAG: hypothetical protein BWY97_00069 [Tenericutes bacterium ADurb.BinA124]
MTLAELIEVLDCGYRVQNSKTKKGIPLNKDTESSKYQITSIYAKHDDLIIIEVEEGEL